MLLSRRLRRLLRRSRCTLSQLLHGPRSPTKWRAVLFTACFITVLASIINLCAFYLDRRMPRVATYALHLGILDDANLHVDQPVAADTANRRPAHAPYPVPDRPPSLPVAPSLVSQPLRTRVDQLVGDGGAAKDALIARYFIPHPVVHVMTQAIATRLYWKLMYVDVVRALNTMDSTQLTLTRSNLQSRATVLFIHVQNGLGNRLRALASGLALARATHRVPVVIWQPDPHLNASAHQLLQIAATGSDFNTVLYKDLIVMEHFLPWSLVPLQHTHFKPFNYMEKDGRGAHPDTVMHFAPLTDSIVLKEAPDTVSSSVPLQIVLQHQPLSSFSPLSFDSPVIKHHQHVYFKSAYVAKLHPSALVTRTSVRRELRDLVPAPAVTKIVSNLNATRLQNSYGIHIRSRSLVNDNVDVNNHCEYSIDGALTTDYWRSSSQLPAFVSKMQERLRMNEIATFFVATDDVDVTAKLKLMFPNKIYSIDRNCDNRDAQCVIFAFADLISLSRTRRIYGSNWSSFSEVVGMLSSKKMVLSGRDFGRQHKPKPFTQIINRLAIFGLRLWLRVRYPFFQCP